MLGEFWNERNSDEKSDMKKMYESDNPSMFEYDETSTKLVIKRQKELSETSRTSALWLNYARYIFIVQEFIQAERTSNWLLHMLTTKSMLNLFPATAHNNYTKTTRLYLQYAAALEKDHPALYQQFLLGNHTVKRTNNYWSGIWTDLLIEQILMKSLKGRSGVFGKGISENVMHVWTKTMHRY